MTGCAKETLAVSRTARKREGRFMIKRCFIGIYRVLAHRLEGLIAVAEQQEDWAELERLKERLRALIEQMA